jgi:hypothetical protein
MTTTTAPTPTGTTYHDRVREAKREILAAELVRHQGNRTHAARSLGIPRTYLSRLARDLGLGEIRSAGSNHWRPLADSPWIRAEVRCLLRSGRSADEIVRVLGVGRQVVEEVERGR